MRVKGARDPWWGSRKPPQVLGLGYHPCSLYSNEQKPALFIDAWCRRLVYHRTTHPHDRGHHAIDTL
jgi:hypothetical protein